MNRPENFLKGNSMPEAKKETALEIAKRIEAENRAKRIAEAKASKKITMMDLKRLAAGEREEEPPELVVIKNPDDTISHVRKDSL